MSNQLSEYVVKLLDRVRTHDELELVLNKTGKPNEEKYNTLARLKLAVQYGEKRVRIVQKRIPCGFLFKINYTNLYKRMACYNEF